MHPEMRRVFVQEAIRRRTNRLAPEEWRLLLFAANRLCYYEAVSVFTIFWAGMKIMMEELEKVLLITKGCPGGGNLGHS